MASARAHQQKVLDLENRLQKTSTQLSLALIAAEKLEEENMLAQKDREKLDLQIREAIQREADTENRRAKELDEAASTLELVRKRCKEKLRNAVENARALEENNESARTEILRLKEENEKLTVRVDQEIEHQQVELAEATRLGIIEGTKLGREKGVEEARKEAESLIVAKELSYHNSLEALESRAGPVAEPEIGPHVVGYP